MKKLMTAAFVTMASLPAQAGTLTDIFDSFYVLGDSLSDNSNTTTMIGQLATLPENTGVANFRPPEPLAQPGVSSDGFTWAKEFTDEFGDSGVNLAFRSAVATDDGEGPPDLAAQISAETSFTTSFTFYRDAPDEFTLTGTVPKYLDGQGGLLDRIGDGSERELVAVFVGGNDFLNTATSLIGQTIFALENGIAPPTEEEINMTLANLVTTTLTSVVTSLNVIVAAGVEDLIVYNLPDFGVIPAFNEDTGNALLDGLLSDVGAALAQAATQYNQLLSLQLQVLEGATVTEVDFFSALTDAERIAAAGIFNMSDTCVGAGVSDCSGYLYFDDIHPTSDGHALLADLTREALAETYAPVPVPASGLLMISAFGASVLIRRRRRHAS